MIIARTATELDTSLSEARRDARSIGFVPTMGALHAGHLSLVEQARAVADLTVCSVYLNPTQFRPGEDLSSYPADADRDVRLLERIGCDVLFMPDSSVVYPDGFGTQVISARSLSSVLCGAHRGVEHFDGVTTVVARLFGLVRPDFAIFGEKDWQQCAVIARMIDDLFPSIQLITATTIRDADGLALSSRNSYLSPQQRANAAAIPAALKAASDAAGMGAHAAIEAAVEIVSSAGLEVEYVEIRDGRTLELQSSPDQHSRIFISARCGSTRLIDNQKLLDSDAPGINSFPVTQQRPAHTATEAATA
jgi:pantoate--beta-alanine ligase